MTIKLDTQTAYAHEFFDNPGARCDQCNSKCKKGYNLKYVSNDQSILKPYDLSSEYSLCRKCMIKNGIETKLKSRCIPCNKITRKSSCPKCQIDDKLRDDTIRKIKSLVSKIERQDHIVQVSDSIIEFLTTN